MMRSAAGLHPPPTEMERRKGYLLTRAASSCVKDGLCLHTYQGAWLPIMRTQPPPPHPTPPPHPSPTNHNSTPGVVGWTWGPYPLGPNGYATGDHYYCLRSKRVIAATRRGPARFSNGPPLGYVYFHLILTYISFCRALEIKFKPFIKTQTETQREILNNDFFNLAKLFLENENKKKTQEFCHFQEFFSPFFEIKRIQLATSRPRHFLGHHF
jgi:hypothetical protein